MTLPTSRAILVVGATSAIATACARRWAARHDRLFVVGRDAAKLDATAADLRVRGAASVVAWPMDSVDLDAHDGMIDACIAALGAVDIVLIAHGTLPDQAACEADPRLALREFATNSTSTIALLAALANWMERQGHGAIGVITSVAGDRGRPSNYTYGSAKAAVSTFCEGLRARLFRHGITVTDIRPGFVATPMTRGLALPPLLTTQPDSAARRIVEGLDRGAAVLYVPGYWRVIMAVIRAVPTAIFNRIRL